MWGVPADHELFNTLSNAQWLWYFHNFSKDEEERFNNKRDLAEYVASFISPEAVQNVRKARGSEVKKIETTQNEDDLFMSRVGKLFGRPLKKDLPEIQDDNFEILQHMIENDWTPRPTDESKNYKHWATIDLG